MKRLHALVLLLRSRNEYLPTVQGARLASAPGPAPGQKVPCRCAETRTIVYRDTSSCPPDCKVKHEHIERRRIERIGNPRCSSCEGTGWRKRNELDDDEGPAVYDEYTYAADKNAIKPSKARLVGWSTVRTMTTKELDLELARLRADERARAGITDNREAYGWEREHARRDRNTSHPQLERALEQLRGTRPGLHGLLVGYYCENRYAELSPGAHFALGRALIALARFMPLEIHVPQSHTDALNGKARSAEVVSIWRKTNSVSAAARGTGLRRGKVRYILRQERAI